jgi:hypothetical protein
MEAPNKWKLLLSMGYLIGLWLGDGFKADPRDPVDL